VLLLGLMGRLVAIAAAAPPVVAPAAPPTANATIEDQQVFSDPSLGDAQGVTVRDGKYYIYGDVTDAKPRVGVIREYDAQVKPTGRVVWLRRDGKPLLVHPTGLTTDEKWGTFLGDTRFSKAHIYRLDWDKMWADGNLDHAVRDEIDDDAAVTGCRPEFVSLDGKALLATADYGDCHPEVRLYDPELMLKFRRTSAPGVTVHRVLAGPFNQNLHWDAATGRLICIQNVTAGRGWQLDEMDLARAVADGRFNGPGVRQSLEIFEPKTELEGFRPLADGRAVFITSSPKDNIVVGRIQGKQ